jgi:DNA-binding CsgD family transcriptional regulator
MSGNPNLTPRELVVLQLLVLGKTNRQIARKLDRSEATVKAHLSSIFLKLGVSNRTEAAIVGLGFFPDVAGFGELTLVEDPRWVQTSPDRSEGIA